MSIYFLGFKNIFIRRQNSFTQVNNILDQQANKKNIDTFGHSKGKFTYFLIRMSNRFFELIYCFIVFYCRIYYIIVLAL